MENAAAGAGAVGAGMEAEDTLSRHQGRPENSSNVPRDTDTELQAAARSIFRRQHSSLRACERPVLCPHVR